MSLDTDIAEISITGVGDDVSVVSILVDDGIAYPAMDVHPLDYPRMIIALRTIADALEDDSPVMH